MKTKEDFVRINLDGSPYVAETPDPFTRRGSECDHLKVAALEAVLKWEKAERALIGDLLGAMDGRHEHRARHMAEMSRKFPDLLISLGASSEEIADWAAFRA